MQPPARIPKALVSLFGVLALLVASAATAGAQEHESETTTQSAKAISDHSCDEAAWHFIITDVQDHEAPGSISVTFEDGTTETISLEKVTGNAAHYTSAENVGLRVTGATAQLPAGWNGQFNLSSGPCTFVEGDDEENQELACPDGTMVEDLADCLEDGSQPDDDELDCPDGQEAVMGDDGTEECVAVEGDEEENDENGADKITICHATGSESNPYVIITIAKQAVLNGHLDHQDGRDIIPAFDDFEGQPVGQGPITSVDDCPATVVDDDDDDRDDVLPEIELANVAAVCVAGELATIGFDLTGDVEDTFTVVLLDGESEIDEVEVEVVDGEGAGSFDFPATHDGVLSVAVTVDGETVTAPVVLGTCEITTVPGGDDDDETQVPGPPIVEGGDETPIEESPVIIPPITEVEGDEAVNEGVTDVPTFRPVVQPSAPVTLDQPTVLGDTVTRSVAGQAVSGQLPRTGNDAAAGLAPFGLLLLLAGFALQRTGRRRSTIG